MSTETDTVGERFQGLRGEAGGQELLLNGHESVRVGGRKVLETDGGDGCTAG